MTYDEIKTAWDVQADEHNQWDSLSEDEKVEAQFKHLDLTQEPDAWGVPRYKHAAIWLAWEAWQAARSAPVDASDCINFAQGAVRAHGITQEKHV